MGRILIGLVIGLLVGGVLTFYFFVGVPSASQGPGTPIRPPDPGGIPAGTAQIVLRQEFFNTVLETIFQEMQAPKFPLGGGDGGQGCDSVITILKEGSGTQTAVRFDNGTISAPLAFSGSYNSPFGCLRFTGWAQANLELRYDGSQQAVFGRINVVTVNLDGVNPMFGGLVTPLVQSTLNSSVNPIKIIDGRQVAVDAPIVSANANLKAIVSDVRAQVENNALNLYITYDFGSGPFTPPQQPAAPSL